MQNICQNRPQDNIMRLFKKMAAILEAILEIAHFQTLSYSRDTAPRIFFEAHKCIFQKILGGTCHKFETFFSFSSCVFFIKTYCYYRNIHFSFKTVCFQRKTAHVLHYTTMYPFNI